VRTEIESQVRLGVHGKELNCANECGDGPDAGDKWNEEALGRLFGPCGSQKLQSTLKSIGYGIGCVTCCMEDGTLNARDPFGTSKLSWHSAAFKQCRLLEISSGLQTLRQANWQVAR